MTKKSHRVIIAPVLSGKSTYVKTNVRVFETDAAKTNATEETLKELRRTAYLTGNWQPHNALWHAQLVLWAGGLPDDSVVLAHSYQDAVEVGKPVGVVLISEGELERRLRSVKNTERAQLALLNRVNVEKSLDEHPELRMWSSVKMAVDALRIIEKRGIVN
jgi:hypothetical protein